MIFRFKQFEVIHEQSAMKVGTDGVLLGAWANVIDAKSALDIGAGTGLISLMLAQRNKHLKVDAVEIDKASFTEMQQNFQNSPWTNRLNSFLTDIAAFKPSRAYDVIVSNPPFFDKGTQPPSKSRLNARHNHSLPQQVLIGIVNNHLQPNGKFCIILPPDEGEKFITESIYSGLFLNRKIHFLAKEGRKTERYLLEFGKEKQPLTENKFIQYNADNSWHADYKELTKEFYLKL